MTIRLSIRETLGPLAAQRTPLRILRVFQRYGLVPPMGVRTCLQLLENRLPPQNNHFSYTHGEKKRVKNRTTAVVDNYKKIKEGKWYSYLHKNIITPQKIWHPSDLSDLVGILKVAAQKGVTVKAVGSGHSFSDVYNTRGWLIDTHNIKGIVPLRTLWLKKRPMGFDGKVIEDLRSLIQIKSGTTIKDLNTLLEQTGDALYNMGGYDGQTFIGAASTSTHGTGITLPPLCDMILSLVIVTEGGKTYRIEPTNGITNVTEYPTSQPKLIQDDDTFYSVIVSMGCMGVVYSVIIQTRKAYVLREKRKVAYWGKLKKKLEQNNFRGDGISTNRHYNVLINPYISRSLLGFVHKDKRLCLINTINEVNETVPDDRPARTADSSLEKCIVRKLRFMDSEEIARTMNVSFDFLALRNTFNYINKSYKTFIAGGVGIGGYAAEWSFPLSESLKALDVIFRTLNEAKQKGEQIESGPISLRYVRRSKAYLSPQYGRDSCMIELISVYATPGWPGDYVLMHRFYDRLIQIGGRPHWGLEFNDITNDSGLVNSLYPKFGAWLRVYQRFNRNGTFNNAFTDRLGISM